MFATLKCHIKSWCIICTFSQECLWPFCAVTRVSVLMWVTHTCADVRPDTWAATVMSRWTSASRIPARTEPPAPITWEDTAVRYENTHTCAITHVHQCWLLTNCSPLLIPWQNLHVLGNIIGLLLDYVWPNSVITLIIYLKFNLI